MTLDRERRPCRWLRWSTAWLPGAAFWPHFYFLYSDTLAGQTPPGDREMGIEDVLVPLPRLLHLYSICWRQRAAAASGSLSANWYALASLHASKIASMLDWSILEVRLRGRRRCFEIESDSQCTTCEATQTRPRCLQRMSECRALSTAVYSRSCTPAQATSTRYYSSGSTAGTAVLSYLL